MAKKTISSLNKQESIDKNLVFPVEDSLSTKKMTMETLLNGFLGNLAPPMVDYVVEQEEKAINTQPETNTETTGTKALCTKTKEGIITISGVGATGSNGKFEVTFPTDYKMKDKNYSAVATANDLSNILMSVSDKSEGKCTFGAHLCFNGESEYYEKSGTKFNYTIKGKAK